MARSKARDDRLAPATAPANALIVSVAEVSNHGAVVIVPPPVSPANLLPRRDSREELQRDRGNASLVPKRKSRPDPESWPAIGMRVVMARETTTTNVKRMSNNADSTWLRSTGEDRVATARRVYDQRTNRRTAAPLVALDPLVLMRDQQEQAIKQQKCIRDAVESRIDHVSRVIPIQFLLEKEERHVFAERALLLEMCRAFHRHYTRVLRAALFSWRKHTLALRILEEQERKLFLLRQASLPHACAIIQRRIMTRQHIMLVRWKELADWMRYNEYMRNTRCIQKCWRSSQMKRKLKTLALLYRDRVRDASALTIQCATRCYIARASVYRHYVIIQITKRHRQIYAAIEIQRIWKVGVGRQLAFRRRNSCRDTAKLACESLWITQALQYATIKHVAAQRIQHLCRVYRRRQRINSGLCRVHQRRFYLPACRVQKAWFCFRANEVRFVCDGLVFRVLMTHLSAAQRIQHCFRVHWFAKINEASQKLSRLFRCYRARRQLVNILLLPCLRVWSEYLVKWAAACAWRSQSKWTVPLHMLSLDIVRYEVEQKIGPRRLNIKSGLQLLRCLKQFQERFLAERATEIQQLWRWYRIRIFVSQLRRAVQVLQRAIPKIFHLHKQRRRRQRVLHRLTRARYINLHYHFETWRLYHLQLIQERDLAATKHKLRKATWFHHHKSRQHTFQRWREYLDICKTQKAKASAAIAHNRVTSMMKTWHNWKQNALPVMCCANQLDELTMILTVWVVWRGFLMRKARSEVARGHRERHVKRTTFQIWQNDRDDFMRSMQAAAIVQERLVTKHAFHALRTYGVNTLQVRAFCREKQNRYSIRQWLLRVYAVKRDRDQRQIGLMLRWKHLIQSTWRLWTRYVRHQSNQRVQRQKIERYHDHRRLRLALQQWHLDFVPLSSDNRLIQSVADTYRSGKLLEIYFRNGCQGFWALTVGARRIAMAIRIQRAFRSKRARHKIFVMRMKIRYQLENRALSGADTTELSTTTLQATLKSTPWVFVLFSVPWCPTAPSVKETFCKVATTWVFVRKQGHQMVFGHAFASSMLKTSNEDEFSLMSWFGLQPTQLPCVVAFWNGVGPASSPDNTSRLATGNVLELKRRYKKLCGRQPDGQSPLIYRTDQVSSPFLTSRLVVWIEHIQDVAREATAVDLQSYMRGFLARCHTKRARIIKRERQKQRIRDWVRTLVKQWKDARGERAAVHIQCWIRHLLEKWKFWRSLRLEMNHAKTAIHRLQRAIRLHLTRVRLRNALASLLATATRYPNAPLCQECVDTDQTLARLFCRDCQQLYCSNCFTRVHKSGKRTLHLCDSIDFAAFQDDFSSMCSCCEVRRASKVCWTCVEEAINERPAMCNRCFERRHSDEQDQTSVRVNVKQSSPWWRSEKFQKHTWKRLGQKYESSPMHATQDSDMTESMVMEKHHWQSKARLGQQLLETTEAEKSLREREDKLLAIRVQHEAILRDAFDRFDSDKSGAIDRNEIKRMLKEELCEPLSDSQVDEAMKCMDKSGNGLVEFDELLSWFAVDTLEKNENGIQASEPRSLAMLKDALRAKRQMRRYKERLNEFVPSVRQLVSPASALTSALSQLTERKPQKKTVPGFPSVHHLEHADFASKRKVFYRFVQEICGLDWIYEDERVIPITNAMEVFDEVFVPRWNGGDLTYDFYFDDESFEFEGEVWQRKWVPEMKKYVFTTTRRKTRKVDTSEEHTGIRKRRKRGSASDGSVGVVEVEESVEIVEAIDPRRRQMLLEEAKEAFKKADVDGSGFVDEHEFHKMLNRELCEPVSKAKARQIMKQLDADGSGKIDFHEFFQWYAVDKCQDYPRSPEMERARALLLTRRRAKATAASALKASIAGRLHVQQAISRRRKEQQLAKDCRGASPELIELLHEGFGKLLAQKALTLHNQDVAFARKWLQDKQLNEQNERARVADERAARKAQAKKDARAKKQKRQQRIAAMRKHLKLLLIGPSKKEAHTARVEKALTNLDREIRMVEHQLTFKT